MAKKANTAAIVEILPEIAAEIAQPKSVVGKGYKTKYAERGASLTKKPKDIAPKVLQRGCNDWMHHELARLCNDAKGKLNVPQFEALLEANGIENHKKWNRETKGWEGRLRMSGSMLLRRIVAEADGTMLTPEGAELKAPRNWVLKHTT